MRLTNMMRLVAFTLLLAVTSARAATTVTLIGSATQSGTTYKITATSGVAAGHGVIVATWQTGTANHVTAVTDNASVPNTYNVTDAFQGDTSDNVYLNLSSAYVATAIPTSGNITVTVTGGACVAYDVSTFATSTWLDQKTTHDNSSFAASQSTGTTAATTHQPNVNFAAFAGATGCSANTWGSGWTALACTSLNGRSLYAEWQEVTTTGTQSGTISITAGDTTAAAIASYKEGNGGAAACTPSLGLLRVGRCG